MLALKVTHPFASYSVGDTIDDKDAIKAAMASNPASVVRVNLPKDEAANAPVDESKSGAKAP